MNFPNDYKFASSHEWVKESGEGEVTIGISEHAQQLLGDIVFVELPEIGSKLVKGQAFGVIESVKAASDLYAPLSGELISINDNLQSDPGLVNQSAYQTGWLIKIKPSNMQEWSDLLSADAYKKMVDEIA